MGLSRMWQWGDIGLGDRHGLWGGVGDDGGRGVGLSGMWLWGRIRVGGRGVDWSLNGKWRRVDGSWRRGRNKGGEDWQGSRS